MNPETMQAGTRVCFLAKGEFCGGQWTGCYGSCGQYVILCDQCFEFHWIYAEDFLPIPDLSPEDFTNEPKLTYRERLQIEEDEAQAEYLSRHAEEGHGRYAAFAFPLVVAGLCACVVGGVNIADGNYGFGMLGVLLFVGAFLFADRLERGV